MPEKTLETLFHDGLKDIYYAERQILKALPKMARAAQLPDSKAAFEKHRDETEVHVERLQQVFEIFGKRAQGKTCEVSRSQNVLSTASKERIALLGQGVLCLATPADLPGSFYLVKGWERDLE